MVQPYCLCFVVGFTAIMLVKCAFSGEEQLPNPSVQGARLLVQVYDADSHRPMPFRAVLTASDGNKVDGAGYGLYKDGRFYAEGQFTAILPPGVANLSISAGPNYIPAVLSLEVKPAAQTHIRVPLKRWFSPQALGWYCGDNHVHTQHDPTGEIKITPEYAALQARAEGLDYVTEAGSPFPKLRIEALTRPDFIFTRANEVRPGVMTGHINTPGISRPLTREELAQIYKSPLPIQTATQIVHHLGGIVIYTHTLPLPRLHWMGATEAFSDAVLGRTADAFDVATPAEELCWYMLLNLGARLAVSASTDTALERQGCPPPGARRVYSYAERFDYASIIDGIRRGRTFITNGGPLFLFLSSRADRTGLIEVHALHPLKRVELILNGRSAQSFPVTHGQTRFEFNILEGKRGWYVARAEDVKGNWALTSPMYLEQYSAPSKSHVLALEIANYVDPQTLSNDYFAHVIVTVSQGPIAKVSLLRNGSPIKEFTPASPNRMGKWRTPCTGFALRKGYEEGWIWAAAFAHFQADVPVTTEGWYNVCAITENGEEITSQAVHFQPEERFFQQISLMEIVSQDNRLILCGYGEEPGKESWWYSKNSYWHIEADLMGRREILSHGNTKMGDKFRATSTKK